MRLVNTFKKQSFKNWVTQHNPKLDWNFNDPKALREQLVSTIKVSGDIDLVTIFHILFSLEDSELSIRQNDKFIHGDY